MCNHGDTVALPVTVPAHLSYSGKDRDAVKPIDRCISPIVAALNEAGIHTAASCCGHGKGDGSIVLHDGRELIIKTHPHGPRAPITSPYYFKGSWVSICEDPPDASRPAS